MKSSWVIEAIEVALIELAYICADARDAAARDRGLQARLSEVVPLKLRVASESLQQALTTPDAESLAIRGVDGGARDFNT